MVKSNLNFEALPASGKTNSMELPLENRFEDFSESNGKFAASTKLSTASKTENLAFSLPKFKNTSSPEKFCLKLVS